MARRGWTVCPLAVLAVATPLSLAGCGHTQEETSTDAIATLGRANILLMDDHALFRGVQSAGYWQWVGNGCLAATSDTLLFRQWTPSRELRIPRAAVIGVDAPISTRSGFGPHPILRVTFKNEAGRRDSLSWDVSDLDAWLRLLQRRS